MAKIRSSSKLAEEVLDCVFSNSGPFGGDDPAGVNDELRAMNRVQRALFSSRLRAGFAKRLSEMGFGEP